MKSWRERMFVSFTTFVWGHFPHTKMTLGERAFVYIHLGHPHPSGTPLPPSAWSFCKIQHSWSPKSFAGTEVIFRSTHNPDSPSNSGEFRFSSGSSTTNVILLVATGILRPRQLSKFLIHVPYIFFQLVSRKTRCHEKDPEVIHLSSCFHRFHLN